MRRGLKTVAAAVIAALSAIVATVGPAAAEYELSVYGGWQMSPASRVSGDHPDGGTYSGRVGWDGKSFESPPYYGLRGTWWQTPTRGWALELTHAKVYAPGSDRAALGFDRMEMTDGHNILTVNYMMRWPEAWGALTPYAGAGLGIALPHVDVTSAGGERTYGYQLTGPAVRGLAGVSYALGDNWSIFGEYQFTASRNEATLEGGGTFETDIMTNAVNLGVGFQF